MPGFSKLDQARLAAFDQVQGIKDQTTELQGRFELQQKIVGLSTNEQQRQTELFDLEQRRKSQLDAIAKIKDLPYDERLAREKELNAEYEKRIGLINEEAKTRAARDNDFVAGVEESMKKYAESMTPLKQGAAMAESVYGNMTSALDRFVDTGKFKFSDFATSIIMDLIKIQLRAQATQLFNSVLGTFGFSLPGRAAGGPVTAGQPYIVGERGPEVFLPTSSGTIVSNDKLGSNGGGGNSTYVNYNINAVDAPSFRQLLARDPSFLYAVTEQGRKTIPATRR
jgi:lambda family phage tail tape measure protein